MNFYTNIDANTVSEPFLRKVCENEHVTEEMLYPYVDVYAGSQITDILINVYVQISMSDSDVFTDYADKYEAMQEQGIPVDYKNHYSGVYGIQVRHGIDPFSAWIKRIRANGQKAWLSFRMNDSHLPFEEVNFLRPSYFYEAREKGMIIGNGYGWNNYFHVCLNYAFKEVRDKMLAYITEQLDRYDVDGIELDYMREIFCFDYKNFDGAEILNAFMREIKAVVKGFETKYGHKIRIGVRLTRDIDQSRKFGMDARTWVREGLVDLVAACPRWATCDSHMPVDVWKKECPGVEIAAGIEINTSPYPMDNYHRTTPAAARGFATHYFAKGADSLYLFNYFMNPFDEPSINEPLLEVNATCGTLESASCLPFRYPLTWQERETVPEGFKSFMPLPVTLTDEAKTFNMDIGIVPENRNVFVLVGFEEGKAEDAEIAVNGRLINDWQKTDRGAVENGVPDTFACKDTILYISKLPTDTSLYQITLTAKGNTAVRLSYLCIDVL